MVAKSKAAIGSCVTVTLVSPPNVRLDAPSAMLVVPTVNELFVNEPLPMLVSVFVAPLIVLLVSVCDAVLVVTVSAPTVAVVMLNVPSVTVLPVNVNAVGRFNVTTVPTCVEVISLAVPLTALIAPMVLGVIDTLAAAVSCP